ncbi:MAG: DUF1294 domain-containing protein [Saccharofermentanales bacterium]
MEIFIGYLIAINIVGLIAMGTDKRRSIKGRWRISERMLFLVAAMGGSLGSIIGMHLFRHKTKHWYFKYGIPAILLVQCILFYILYKYPII